VDEWQGSTDDSSALLIVLVDSHGHDVLLSGDAKLDVDFMFDRETVSVPSEPTLDVVARRVSVAGHDVLYIHPPMPAIKSKEDARSATKDSEAKGGSSSEDLLLLGYSLLAFPCQR
jgi:hypothetical protein